MITCTALLEKTDGVFLAKLPRFLEELQVLRLHPMLTGTQGLCSHGRTGLAQAGRAWSQHPPVSPATASSPPRPGVG